ncbi:hypothetical protein [Nesterenkonia sp. K-15-9-6]|uniref:hypothetical protein n=1 Tax=Nesterenkonia sp. K-15-9-6 TaxID=3093918 RepID=UPI004043AE6D
MTCSQQHSALAPTAPPVHRFTAAQRAADRAVVTVLVGLVLLPMLLGPLALILVRRTRRLGGEPLRWVVVVAWIEIVVGILILAVIAMTLFSLLTMAAHGSAS